jgi:hypothetical protein
LFFIPAALFSRIDPSAYSTQLAREIGEAGTDSLRIVKLSELAFFYADQIGNNTLADSAAMAAIWVAEKSHRPELLVLAYSLYVESVDLHDKNRKALDFAIKAEQAAATITTPGISFRTLRNLVTVYLAGYQYDKALATSYKLLSVAATAEKNQLKAQSYLYIGQSLEGKNQKIEAFRNYLNALSLAQRTHDDELKRMCYSRLSKFYNFSKIYTKATHYKLLERELILAQKPVDSVAYFWSEFDLQVIDLNSNNNQLHVQNMKDILDFAKRKAHNRLLQNELALIRTHYIEANQIKALFDFYHTEYPQELGRLSSENPALYFRLKAFFCEEGNSCDSALYFFNKAEEIIQHDPNKILQSNFYNRFGEFLLRQNQESGAIEKFTKSLELAGAANYFEYMLNAAKQLENICAGNGDYKNAYLYSTLNKVLNDSLNNMSKKDQMLIMEIDHESRQREIAAEQEKQSTTRRHYLQYSAITIGILTVFVILIMLGSLRVPEWIIRMLGFFSFIFLFEFIILIADHKIHEITHGEPWKVLLIKIFLIAILLPLHHSIEKKVITYLLNHKLLDISKVSLGKWVKKQSTSPLKT